MPGELPDRKGGRPHLRREISELELLLQGKEQEQNRLVDRIQHDVPPERTKAEKSCTVDEFIEMIGQVVSKTLGKKYGAEFRPNEGERIKLDPEHPIDHPYITYKIVNMQPDGELKPRLRESIYEKVKDARDKEMARPGHIWGQKFSCTVQFDIIAGDYKGVAEVINAFEELMFNYSAYFKRNGVQELLYGRRFTDSDLDMYRQSTSARTVQYNLKIERLYSEFVTEIDGVTID